MIGETLDPPVTGVFVGRCTLDIVVDGQLPELGAKVDVTGRWRGAGGPAANAAASFSLLGGRAVLLTQLGTGLVAAAARSELEHCGVQVLDVAPPGYETAVSLCWGHPDGRRTVASAVAPASPLAAGRPLPEAVGELRVDTIVYDKELPHLLAQLRDAFPDATTVYDAGRPSEQGRALLAHSGHVIAPNHDFYWSDEAAQQCSGAQLFAISRGPAPLAVHRPAVTGRVMTELPVPPVPAVDTTGAGDVLHGAYAFFLSRGQDPVRALGNAAAVAAASTTRWGPRAGVEDYRRGQR